MIDHILELGPRRSLNRAMILRANKKNSVGYGELGSVIMYVCICTYSTYLGRGGDQSGRKTGRFERSQSNMRWLLNQGGSTSNIASKQANKASTYVVPTARNTRRRTWSTKPQKHIKIGKEKGVLFLVPGCVHNSGSEWIWKRGIDHPIQDVSVVIATHGLCTPSLVQK